jgi:aldehyde:ferredoxin oxidoreductase
MPVYHAKDGKYPDGAVRARCTLHLNSRAIVVEEIPYHNLESILGGFGRSFQTLAERNINNAYSPGNPLILNTGIFTGGGFNNEVQRVG